MLLDTGALVTLLDRSQREHATFRDFFERWTGAVASTEAVLTEAAHLLGRVPGGREACIDFFLSGGAVLVPSTPSSLRRSRRLLEDYADQPMDYADATLVVLAEELDTDLVLTMDRRDFGVYRIRDARWETTRPGRMRALRLGGVPVFPAGRSADRRPTRRSARSGATSATGASATVRRG